MEKTIGRNDPCPCGSGNKYKKCCWGKDTADIKTELYSKRQGRFNEALALANDFLKHLPHDPEALFLKAQILHEGFGYGTSAKKCLELIMKEVPTSETLHRWAASYLESIGGEGEMEEGGGKDLKNSTIG